MKRTPITCILVLVLAASAHAQADSASIVPRIRAAADSMLAAFKEKDYRTFARFNNEKLVETLGGPDNFAAFLDQQIKSMEGLAFTEIRTGRIIRVVPYRNTWQCIVEQQSQVNLPGQVISSISHLVGLSTDGGNTWHFADANQGSLDQFRTIMPELNPAMPIPKKKQVPDKTLDQLLSDYQTSYRP
jgi:hypothetical protein